MGEWQHNSFTGSLMKPHPWLDRVWVTLFMPLQCSLINHASSHDQQAVSGITRCSHKSCLTPLWPTGGMWQHYSFFSHQCFTIPCPIDCRSNKVFYQVDSLPHPITNSQWVRHHLCQSLFSSYMNRLWVRLFDFHQTISPYIDPWLGWPTASAWYTT